MKFGSRLGLCALLALSIAVSADDDAPKNLDASDTAAIAAAKDTEVIVQGKINSAEWSKSGKVCNITFENAPGFMAVAFVKSRKKLDEAFGGDAAKQLAGATVKLSGKLGEYKGYDKKFKDAMQLIIKDTSQVTVVTAATQPTTQAAG